MKDVKVYLLTSPPAPAKRVYFAPSDTYLPSVFQCFAVHLILLRMVVFGVEVSQEILGKKNE